MVTFLGTEMRILIHPYSGNINTDTFYFTKFLNALFSIYQGECISRSGSVRDESGGVSIHTH